MREKLEDEYIHRWEILMHLDFYAEELSSFLLSRGRQHSHVNRISRPLGSWNSYAVRDPWPPAAMTEVIIW